jgi:drug/metabolite transporter (DMT)-like permease
MQLLGTGAEGKWSKPYFESFLYHAVWALLLPVAYLYYYLEKKWVTRKNDATYPPVPYRQLLIWGKDEFFSFCLFNLSLRIGAFSGPAIVFSSLFYFLEISRLTLSIASALVQCYFLIVFILSYFFLDERLAVMFFDLVSF